MPSTATINQHSIFISYRVDDAAGWASRLDGDLSGVFGAERVFLDATKLRAGTDWEQEIEGVLDSCDAVVVVIGPRWTTAAGADGSPRLWEDGDILRREVQRALERSDVGVFPVLVQGARMPRAHDLPPELHRLLRVQAITMSDRHWNDDVAELVAQLRTVVTAPPPLPTRLQRSREPPPPPLTPRERTVAACAIACAAALGVLIGLPATAGLVDLRRLGEDPFDRIVYYAAERAVIWALVAAFVLAAAAATLRRHRTGGPAYALVGLGVGAIAGAISGAAYMALKDNDVIASEHLLRAITMAIAGIALAAIVARLVEGQRSIYMLAGLAGGLLAGILAERLFGGGAGRSGGMVVFEVLVVTGAITAVATTAAADFAGRAGGLGRS